MTAGVNIPEELFRQAREIADSQHSTVDDVVSSAFADQLAAWERLKQRAARGDRARFFAALDKVPDIEPEDYDRI